MARKDKVEEIEEVEEEVAAEEEAAVEEVVEDVEAEEEAIEDVTAAADDDEPPEDIEPEEERGPKPQTPGLVIVLAGLNILAAAGFVFLLLMNYSKRSEWSYAVFRHDLDILGLPLESESDGVSGSRDGRASQKLTSDQIKQAFSRRGGNVTEPFLPVDEVLASPILPEHLTEATLQDIFQGLGKSVRTLEEEVRRIKEELPGLIEQAGKAYAATAKGEADQRKKLEDMLLPLSISGPQVELIAKRIKDAPVKSLDAMLVDAAQRRMLVDLLAPLDVHRPAKLPPSLEAWQQQRLRVFDNAADAQIIKLDDLKSLLIRRLDLAMAAKYDEGLHFGPEWTDESRTSFEKRPAIAYLLVTISHAKKPDGTLLVARTGSRDRAQVVAGWHEYNQALQQLTSSLLALHQRVVTAIKADREGQDILDKDGKPAVNPGFVHKHAAEIERLKSISAMIQNRDLRLKDLEKQLARHNAYYTDRLAHEQDVQKTLAAARLKTAAERKELQVLQAQLHDAQEKLRTASGINVRLESDIRRHMGLQVAVPEVKVP